MALLGRLIGSLGERAPLERSTSEMAALLTAACVSWSAGRPLLSRPRGYTRSCAYKDARFEVLLLNCDAGAASEIHDHGGQHCWMLVLDGQLQIDDYVRLDNGKIPGVARVEACGSQTLAAGGLDLRSGRFDLHRVSAANGVPAVSLHVYAAPLRRFMVYNELEQRCRSATGRYDDVLWESARSPVSLS